MAEKKKPGRKPGEPKVKRLISLPASTDANIEREAKARKKPMTVPAFIAAALESKFGVPTDGEPTNVTVGDKSSEEVAERCIHPIGRRIGTGCGACGKESIK